MSEYSGAPARRGRCRQAPSSAGAPLRERTIRPASVVAHAWHHGRRRRQGQEVWESTAPIVWPPPHTYPQLQRLARDVLPGARFRRRLLWRYSLVWERPG